MLRIKSFTWAPHPAPNDSVHMIFDRNPVLVFEVEAPIFWWMDTRFQFEQSSLANKKDLTDFCFDSWKRDSEITQDLAQTLRDMTPGDDFRKYLEILPLSTQVTGFVYLTYQEVVEYVKDYLSGDLFANDFLPTKREWTDFCETLLDIKGIRELTGKETDYAE